MLSETLDLGTLVRELVRESLNAAGYQVDRAEIVTVAEIAQELQLERKSIYALIALGQLPGVRKLGRCIRIHRATVIDWIASGQVPASRSRR